MASLGPEQIPPKNPYASFYLEDQPRAITRWHHEYILEISNIHSIWKHIWFHLALHTDQDTLWLASHLVLTTKEYLSTWGMNIDTSCPFCNNIETIHHVFRWHRTRSLWSSINRLFGQLGLKSLVLSLTELITAAASRHSTETTQS